MDIGFRNGGLFLLAFAALGVMPFALAESNSGDSGSSGSNDILVPPSIGASTAAACPNTVAPIACGPKTFRNACEAKAAGINPAACKSVEWRKLTPSSAKPLSPTVVRNRWYPYPVACANGKQFLNPSVAKEAGENLKDCKRMITAVAAAGIKPTASSVQAAADSDDIQATPDEAKDAIMVSPASIKALKASAIAVPVAAFDLRVAAAIEDIDKDPAYVACKKFPVTTAKAALLKCISSVKPPEPRNECKDKPTAAEQQKCRVDLQARAWSVKFANLNSQLDSLKKYCISATEVEAVKAEIASAFDRFTKATTVADKTAAVTDAVKAWTEAKKKFMPEVLACQITSSASRLNTALTSLVDSRDKLNAAGTQTPKLDKVIDRAKALVAEINKPETSTKDKWTDLAKLKANIEVGRKMLVKYQNKQEPEDFTEPAVTVPADVDSVVQALPASSVPSATQVTA